MVVAIEVLPAQGFQQKIVCEEGGGASCGNCPRGIVGLSRMYQEHPDTFIPISIHSGDELTNSSYSPIFDAFFGGMVPNCVLNRKSDYVIDPNYEELAAAYDRLAGTPCWAEVVTTATYTDETYKKLSVETTMRFAENRDGLNLKLAYVLLEDSIEYIQSNYYANGERGEMGGFEDLPSYVRIKGNHIARTIKSNWKGIANSVPAQVVADSVFTYSYAFALPSSVLDRENLSLVTLLIDADCNEIVNAHYLKTLASSADTGISQLTTMMHARVCVSNGWLTIEGNQKLIDIHAVNGNCVSNGQLTKGLFIIRLSTESGEIISRRISL